MNIPNEIKNFFDSDNLIKQFPSKRSKKKLILDYIITFFDKDREYSEKEINEILNKLHTFNDPALLRRELYEYKMLNRSKDCSKYWI